MGNIDNDLDALLRFDSLNRAEEITGKSYKEDENTTWMGMILMQANAKAKEAALTAQGDSTFVCSLDRYFEILDAEGFESILKIAIPNSNDNMYIFWHRDGIFLNFDSYNGKSVNGGHFSYNWIPNENADFKCMSSHRGGANGIIAGSHDCREAIRFHIRKLRENGRFIVPWVEEPPFFTLLHREEYREYGKFQHEEWKIKKKEIQTERIVSLPDYIREAIHSKIDKEEP